MAVWRGLLLLVLVGVFNGLLSLGSFLVFLCETLNAARRIHQFLLSGEERMAVGADFDAQQRALDCGAGGECVPACAVHCYRMIVRVNIGFHGGLLPSGRSARLPIRCRDDNRVAWSADNLQSYAIPGILAKRALAAGIGRTGTLACPARYRRRTHGQPRVAVLLRLDGRQSCNARQWARLRAR